MKDQIFVPVVLLPLVLFVGCARHGGGGILQQPSDTPRFETRIEVSTGTAAHADFAVGDFNGDGRPDFVVIGLTGELQVMLGTGTTFVPGQLLALGGGPIWIAQADFDRDGDQDLVVVQTQGNTTTVLRNDGGANFDVMATLPVGNEALAVVAADANDDGIPDVIVARPVSPEILVFRNDGSGSFTQTSSIALPGGGVPFGMTVGDVTQDSVADLVVSDPRSDRVLIYAGTGGNSDFESVPIELAVPGNPRATSLGDLSGDGVTDICVSVFERNEFLVITSFSTGGKGGSSYQSFSVPVDGAPSLSAIGDVTGDGLADLVACVAGRASMVVVPQRAGGGLDPAYQLDASGLPLRPAIVDVDRNGRNDLMVLSGLGDRVNLWLAAAEGRLLGARSHATDLPTAPWVAAADFQGDGVCEVVLGGPDASRLSFLRPDGADNLELALSLPVGLPVLNIEAVDLDGDGRLDLVVPCVGGVKLVRNRSTATSLEFSVLPGNGNEVVVSGQGPWGVATADLDRDGNVDLAITDFRTGELMLLFGSAVPFEFPRTSSLAIGGGPVDVCAADFTGDGIVDLAVSRAGASTIQVLRNDGAGQLSVFLDLPVGAAPNYLVTADFNGDRRADLVVSNGNDAAITVLFATGTGFAAVRFPAGNTPTALLAEDLTGDGLPDILVASLVGGDFRVLTSDGQGGFPVLSAFPGTLGATGAALCNLIGDARKDLLVSSTITRRVSLVRNITPPR